MLCLSLRLSVCPSVQSSVRLSCLSVCSSVLFSCLLVWRPCINNQNLKLWKFDSLLRQLKKPTPLIEKETIHNTNNKCINSSNSSNSNVDTIH